MSVLRIPAAASIADITLWLSFNRYRHRIIPNPNGGTVHFEYDTEPPHTETTQYLLEVEDEKAATYVTVKWL